MLEIFFIKNPKYSYYHKLVIDYKIYFFIKFAYFLFITQIYYSAQKLNNALFFSNVNYINFILKEKSPALFLGDSFYINRFDILLSL